VVVDFLLTRDWDAHINKTDPSGQTPLIFAVKFGWTGIVASLLAHNADTDLVSNKKGEWSEALMHCFQIVMAGNCQYTNYPCILHNNST
jgi:ankyrin repeat protein